MTNQSNSLPQPRILTKNYILNRLPEEDLERLRPDLEKVTLNNGLVIYQPEEPIEYVYFPDNAMISVVANTFSGQTAEVGVIGYEGLAGIDVFMGSDMTLNEHVVQLPDGALRIKTAAIIKEFKRAGALHDLILRFVRLLMLQISQTALCNRLHSIEERLVRWLLLCHDRLESDELKLTQEFLGIMLGTNRATVTLAAITLQDVGYIKYKRGLITIKDRAGLEDFSCECYEIIKQEYDRLMT